MELSTKLVNKIKFCSSGNIILKKSIKVVTTQMKTRTKSGGQREFLSVMFEILQKITFMYFKLKKYIFESCFHIKKFENYC